MHSNCVQVPVGGRLDRSTSFPWSTPLDDPGYAELERSEFVNLNVAYGYLSGHTRLNLFGAVTAGLLLLFWVLFELGLRLPHQTATILAMVMAASGAVYLTKNCCFWCWSRASEPLPLAREEFHSLLGRETCTCFTVAFYLLGLALQLTRGGVVPALMYVFISLTAIAVLVPAWALGNRCTPEPINFGLLLSMFWTGGLFSANVASILNTCMLVFWSLSDPYCSPLLPAGRGWPSEPAPATCVAKAWLEWILTPGVIEESLKLVALVRLCTTVEEAARSNCLRRCPRSSENSNFVCCGWFLKLAPSPMSFVLCGMAVGAGFATMENVHYVSQMPDLVSASQRLFAALLHICMTGISSFALAYGVFLKDRIGIKLSGLVLMMLFHGSYDAICEFSSGGLDDGWCATGIACPGSGAADCYFCVLNSTSSEVTPVSTLTMSPQNVRKAHLEATTSKVPLLTFVHRPLRLQFAADPTARLRPNPCPLEAAQYGCHDIEFVPWFPREWPPYAAGLIIIIAFSLVGCCWLPRIERQFRSIA